ncbi:MAG TPA: 4Fe-4S binding protein [Rectinemataceae bacterium]|nr:4Fe-4S binding protein [Rectinemataceae bacterium]
MALREIIEIDETKCDGCGLCATGCPEGALRIIDGKARMVGESLCDGLGACVGTCPRDAILVIKREAEAYDEARVIEGIAKMGGAVIAAHLEHLEQHGQDLYVREAMAWMEAHGVAVPAKPAPKYEACSGTISRRLAPTRAEPIVARLASPSPAKIPSPGAQALASPPDASALSSWPVQLHLLNPRSPQFAEADILIAADCTAYAFGSFHSELLAGRSLAIACPKLDQGRDIYLDKLASLIAGAKSLQLAIMEVPCCSGLLGLVLEARKRNGRDLKIAVKVIGIEGGILREEER